MLQDIPRLEIPLHTLIELVPKPDGKMAEERIHLDVIHETIKKVLTRSWACLSGGVQSSWLPVAVAWLPEPFLQSQCPESPKSKAQRTMGLA